MNPRAWPFLIGAVGLALLGPFPPTLDSPWHVGSVICAAIFFGVVLGSNERRRR